MTDNERHDAQERAELAQAGRPARPGKRSRPGGSCRGASAAASAAASWGERSSSRSGSDGKRQTDTDANATPGADLMELTVVKNATCTFCGCVCDDIELHADGERIVETKRACSLGEVVVQEPHRRTPLSRRPDRRQAGHGRRRRRSRGRVPPRGRHAARLRPQQHHLRSPARGGLAGRTDRRRHRQPHIALTRSNRNRRPVGWQSDLHAGRSQEPGRLHHLLGRQPGRVPSAALHEVHAHAEGQVRPQRPQGPHDGPGRHPRDAERQGRRHLPADPAGQGLRGAHRSCARSSRASASTRTPSPRPA